MRGEDHLVLGFYLLTQNGTSALRRYCIAILPGCIEPVCTLFLLLFLPLF